MSAVETLLNTAYEDTQLLTKNDQLGDDFSISRAVDFVLIAKDQSKANTVASFISDNQYAHTSVSEIDGVFRIIATIDMPSTQQLICSVSGLMACIAELFSIDYNGWGCVIQSRT